MSDFAHVADFFDWYNLALDEWMDGREGGLRADQSISRWMYDSMIVTEQKIQTACG